MHGNPVHLRLGSAALCGVAGPMLGTRDASVVTCEVCRTSIRASGLAQPLAPEGEPWKAVRRQRTEALAGSST